MNTTTRAIGNATVRRKVGVRPIPLTQTWNRLIKRAFDLSLSICVVLVALPLAVLVVFILQRLQSPGPIFCIQKRIGRQRRPFNMLKFRTMHVRPGTEAVQCTVNDQRVYPAGRWLRRCSLDELPQFINVIRGEMSVVGPRPYLPPHDEIFRRMIPGYDLRFEAKPGITGLAQVCGLRGEFKTEEAAIRRFEIDMQYMVHWTLWSDVVVVFSTLPQMVSPPKTAY